MNRKGFTFIELLAVIVLLALILVIGAPSIINTFKSTKVKNEQIFVDRLSEAIEGYVTLNSDKISFGNQTDAQKKIRDGSPETYTVTVYSGQITFNDIINDALIDAKDFVNAGNEESTCSKDATIEVYRDSEYVYCHKVKKDALNCLSADYQKTITGDYAINTCVWTKD